MLLTYAANNVEAAKAIESAVDEVLADGLRTSDLSSSSEAGIKVVSTVEMGDAVAKKILSE